MARNGGAVLFSNAEGNTFRELVASELNDIIAKSYDQETESYLYRNKEIIIDTPSISMLVFLQPYLLLELYRGKMAKRLHESGLTARLLPYIHPNKGMSVGQGVGGYSEDISDEYDNRITRLLNQFLTTDQYAEKYHIRLSEDAQNLIYDFREQCKAMAYSNEMKYWVAKAPGHAVRVAAAYHFLYYVEDGINHAINEENMQLAIATVRTTIQHAQYLYDPYGMEAEQNAEQIITSLRRITDNAQIGNILQSGVTTTYIQQRTKIDRLVSTCKSS